jgi:hypothetical protein
MKRPTAAHLKKVTAENLAGLGVERLAEILVEVAATRVDLKRRLRMELAAGLGATHLVPEIDKRLATLETSRGAVNWRQKPAVLRDLDALRGLIADRLGGLEPDPARERLWRFMATAKSVAARFSDDDGAVDAIYRQAADDLGRLLASTDTQVAANTLIEAVATNPRGWTRWLPALLAHTSGQLAEIALRLGQGSGPSSGWIPILRHLADAANDVEAYRQTYGAAAAATPAIAIEIARRYLAADALEAAGQVLRSAAPKPVDKQGRLAAPDFGWETTWIDYLERTGDIDAAQAVRWASFQRTLDPDRARSFVSRLTGFEDVEAESRAFAYAAEHEDFQRGLAFLMAWPALAEASAMIQARADEIEVDAERAALWAGKLRRRFPAAALILLRRAAAAAFRRREYKTCDRLTQEADTIPAPA